MPHSPLYCTSNLHEAVVLIDLGVAVEVQEIRRGLSARAAVVNGLGEDVAGKLDHGLRSLEAKLLVEVADGEGAGLVIGAAPHSTWRLSFRFFVTEEGAEDWNRKWKKSMHK